MKFEGKKTRLLITNLEQWNWTDVYEVFGILVLRPYPVSFRINHLFTEVRKWGRVVLFRSDKMKNIHSVLNVIRIHIKKEKNWIGVICLLMLIPSHACMSRSKVGFGPSDVTESRFRILMWTTFIPLPYLEKFSGPAHVNLSGEHDNLRIFEKLRFSSRQKASERTEQC